MDDSRTIRLIVGKTFAPTTASCFEAANGEEGLAAAAREKPDLILLDVTMPVMDGVTTLTKLKEDAELKSIPVIMLTAESGRTTCCTSRASACAITSSSRSRKTSSSKKSAASCPCKRRKSRLPLGRPAALPAAAL